MGHKLASVEVQHNFIQQNIYKMAEYAICKKKTKIVTGKKSEF